MDAFDWKYFQIRNAVINIKTSVSFHVISNNRRIKNKTFFLKAVPEAFTDQVTYWTRPLKPGWSPPRFLPILIFYELKQIMER